MEQSGADRCARILTYIIQPLSPSLIAFFLVMIPTALPFDLTVLNARYVSSKHPHSLISLDQHVKGEILDSPCRSQKVTTSSDRVCGTQYSRGS